MCLAALSLGRHERFPLVLAANRDEYLARPASALAWWSPRPDGSPILSGRDLEAGGSWLGLGANGRLALLTNVREPGRNMPSAPSRGGIVTDWLDSVESPVAFWQRHAARPYNGFNLIAGDGATGEWFWGSNRAPRIVRLEAGRDDLYGLSNAALDTPWPKVTTLKRRLDEAVAEAVNESGPVDALAWRLFVALADKGLVEDDTLPSTGVPRDWERLLSAAFIDAGERGYGTRCSTVVITERTRGADLTHVFELTHATDPLTARPDRHLTQGASAPRGGMLADLPGLTHVVLEAWPVSAPSVAR